MIRHIMILCFCITVGTSVSAQEESETLYPEVLAKNLPEPAVAGIQDGEPVIFYNPLQCAIAGQWATRFIKIHEEGHHKMNHVKTNPAIRSPYVQFWLNEMKESDADNYAIRYWSGVDIRVIQGWCRYMWRINSGGDEVHPPSRVRVDNALKYYYSLTGNMLNY